MNWYPQNKEELNEILDNFLSSKPLNKEIHGIVSPHAGYQYSGKIAGKAYSLLKNKNFKKAIIIAPSHNVAFNGIASLNELKTPLGKVQTIQNKHKKINYEHAIDTQIPFLQKLGFKKILPLVIGKINEIQAKEIAEYLIKQKDKETIFIFSTDLSHFLSYDGAIKEDKKTIKIIETLEIKNWKKINACGIYPLLILMNLCKLKNWKPKLIEYKNSGDIISITKKQGVVGYASFFF